MPTAATVQTAGGTQQGTGARAGKPGQQVMPLVPFVRASMEHDEPCGIDVQRLLIASAQDLGVFDIPAYGYIRNIVLVVTGSGGTGTPTFFEDAPFSVLSNIALTEPNGAVIAQFNSGHDLYLANKWGGYGNVLGSDARMAPSTTTDAAGNFSFILRIPIELSGRDGLGSLPNQNAAATFKLRMSLASGAASAALGPVYATAGTLLPTVRVQVYLEAWDQPEVSVAGMTNQVTPPAMNTTQFWSTQIFNVGAGQQTVRLTRVGNYIRNIILIHRKSSGNTPRATGHDEFPDPVTWYLDARPTSTISKTLWLERMFRRSGFGGRPQGGALVTPVTRDTAGGLDHGVYVVDMTHEFDQTIGQENRDLWLPTLGSTRLELQGSFAAAGTLTVLTNDVAIAGPVFL
jgi:hypothetical protein